ncbi:unnamed protein product [Ectocarpus sp. CCAP 1310/34]|nr:unnamed protein product [Ectocarpus sp. CCAP 1310/34]
MQELYQVYVKERKDSVAVELSYPSERYQITKPRGHNLSQDWVRVVQHNTRRSSGEAICTDSMLRDSVAKVDSKNDMKNGPGLLYPTMEWVEFVYAVERGIFHFLKKPIFLAACLGDLPAEIFNVVREAEVVKEMWGKCCPSGPPAIDPSVSQEMFLSVVGKILNVRLGDFAKSVRENTSLKFSKVAPALRQQLKARVGPNGRTGADSGEAKGVAQGGEAAGGGGEGGAKRRKGGRARRQAPPTLNQLKGMSRVDISDRCTVRQLLLLVKDAGIKKGTMNSRQDDLLDYLAAYVGGFGQESVEGAGPSATGSGPAEG